LKWLEGEGKKECPRQGSVPNRFKAKIKDGFDPLKIEQSVQTAWHELADLVWQKDLDEHIGEKQTKIVEIWNRQIEHFWEINWALTDDEEKSDLLDRRKNWRNHFAPNEPGVKCTVMEGWQELSGTAT
jgi:CRISPR-associated protein Cmr2